MKYRHPMVRVRDWNQSRVDYDLHTLPANTQALLAPGFDSGYFVETLQEVVRLQGYDMPGAATDRLLAGNLQQISN